MEETVSVSNFNTGNISKRYNRPSKQYKLESSHQKNVGDLIKLQKKILYGNTILKFYHTIKKSYLWLLQLLLHDFQKFVSLDMKIFSILISNALIIHAEN